jgi:hypothetical protein
MSPRHSRQGAAAGFVAGVIILALLWGTLLFVAANFELLRQLAPSQQGEMPGHKKGQDDATGERR